MVTASPRGGWKPTAELVPSKCVTREVPPGPADERRAGDGGVTGKRGPASSGEGKTAHSIPSQWIARAARALVCPTAQASSVARATTASRRGFPGALGPATTVHCDPSQCSIRVSEGEWPPGSCTPTAQTSSVAVALTARSWLIDEGDGAGTIVQRAPSQCSVSVSKWVLDV